MIDQVELLQFNYRQLEYAYPIFQKWEVNSVSKARREHCSSVFSHMKTLIKSLVQVNSSQLFLFLPPFATWNAVYFPYFCPTDAVRVLQNNLDRLQDSTGASDHEIEFLSELLSNQAFQGIVDVSLQFWYIGFYSCCQLVTYHISIWFQCSYRGPLQSL